MTETAPEGLDPAEVAAQNYGIFSARYGNVYTVKQAVQLVQRAVGKFFPTEDVWQRGDRFVDPFRPTIEPDGFASPDEVRVAAKAHLEMVRRVFTESDIIVFTLGLTEGWLSKSDGAVYPLAPGVSGGAFDPEKYEPVNYSVVEVINDLKEFVDEVLAVNPDVRFLFTVSPVPLIATHEDRHVVVSTAYSKAALRAAVDELERSYQCVTYFPSYEIISSPHAQGKYYEDDLRSVSEVGVSHVMRMFTQHFLTEKKVERAKFNQMPAPLFGTDDDIVCDEEEIERVVRASGLQD